MEEEFIQPSDPETQAPGDRPGTAHRHAYTVKVFAVCPGRDARQPRTLLGRVRIRPGPVAPGHIAAVRLPGGSLTLMRIFYERSSGQEFVRLAPLAPGARAARYPLGEVTIEGTAICSSRAGERCVECDDGEMS